MAKRCFFIMPFAPGFRYFYLYLKHHLETNHDIKCYRVDDVPHFTQAVIEQIKDEIRKADLIIADVTGGNPNVFYELGLAHAQDKFTLLVTHEDYSRLPFDVEALKVLSYQNEEQFLKEVDHILYTWFSPHYYETLHQRAQQLFQQLRQDTNLSITMVNRESFVVALQSLERGGLWSYTEQANDDYKLADLLLSYLVVESRVPEIRQRITEWLVAHYSGQG